MTVISQMVRYRGWVGGRGRVGGGGRVSGGAGRWVELGYIFH